MKFFPKRLFRKAGLVLVLPLVLLATVVTTAGAASAQKAPTPHFTYATAHVEPNGDLIIDFKLVGVVNAYSNAVYPGVQDLTAVFRGPGGQTTVHVVFPSAEVPGTTFPTKGSMITGSLTISPIWFCPYGCPGTDALVSASYQGIYVRALAFNKAVGQIEVSPYAVTPSSLTWP